MPREEINLIEAAPDDLRAFDDARVEFAKHKAAATQTTPYGLQYSPHYSRQSHEQK